MPKQHPNSSGLRRAGQSSIEKAARLVHEGRVRLYEHTQVYLVQGDTAEYRVIAAPNGIFCPCDARDPLCSHVLATAHVREKERLALQLAQAGAGVEANGGSEGRAA